MLTRVIYTDQYSSLYEPLTQKHSTSISICGYLSLACARLLARGVTPSDRNVLPGLEQAMAAIAQSRKAYVDAHCEMFSEQDRKNYLRDWVANYEIVDFLRERL
jgi:hypothetical protein